MKRAVEERQLHATSNSSTTDSKEEIALLEEMQSRARQSNLVAAISTEMTRGPPVGACMCRGSLRQICPLDGRYSHIRLRLGVDKFSMFQDRNPALGSCHFADWSLGGTKELTNGREA